MVFLRTCSYVYKSIFYNKMSALCNYLSYGVFLMIVEIGILISCSIRFDTKLLSRRTCIKRLSASLYTAAGRYATRQLKDYNLNEEPNPPKTETLLLIVQLPTAETGITRPERLPR